MFVSQVVLPPAIKESANLSLPTQKMPLTVKSAMPGSLTVAAGTAEQFADWVISATDRADLRFKSFDLAEVVTDFLPVAAAMHGDVTESLLRSL